MLIPRLDAKEVAAVFTAPLHNFLRATDEVPPATNPGDLPGGKWYSGTWTEWYDGRFRMHNFGVVVKNQVVARAPPVEQPAATTSLPTHEQAQAPYPRLDPRAPALPYRDAPTKSTPDPLDGLERFRVWGMTARMLVDCARVAYGEEPGFEHNSHFGDEALIARLYEMGRLKEARRSGDAFGAADADVRAAMALGRRQEEEKRRRRGSL